MEGKFERYIQLFSKKKVSFLEAFTCRGKQTYDEFVRQLHPCGHTFYHSFETFRALLEIIRKFNDNTIRATM